MQYRRLGKAGFDVSEIAYGAWGIAGDWWKGGDDEQAIASMHLAIDLGINFIDTALGYGEGRSEQLIGQVLRDRSEQISVATKVRPMNYNFGPKPGDSFSEAYSKDWIIECTHESLKNLGQERLDLQMLHVWMDEWADRDEWKEAVVRLREQGKINAFGLSLVFPLEDVHVPRGAIGTGFVDVCQVVYNIFQQEPQEELFPLARENDIGLVARCPLDEGALTGKVTADTTFPEEDWRCDYFCDDRREEVQARIEALEWLLHGDTESMCEAALRFCFSDPAISTVIVGMRRPEHVEDNVKASEKGPLPPEDLERLKDHAWPKNFWE